MLKFFVAILLAVVLTACAPTATQVPPRKANSTTMGSVILQRGDAARTGLYTFPAMRQKPELKWRTQLGPSLYLGTPLLADGTIYTGGSDGEIYAIDAQNGKVLWSGGDFEATDTATAIAGDVIVGSGQNGNVRALNRLNGNMIWSFNVGIFAFAPPLIVDEAVYIATYEKLYALDLKTGKPIWEAPLGSQMNFVSTPASEGDSIYISVGPLLVALDRSSGAERWRVETRQQFFWLALGHGLVYIGSADGYFYAYEQATGKERWKFKSSFGSDEIWAAPAVAGDIVYTGSRDQYVYALNAESGQKTWAFKTAGESVGAPIISDGLVYLSDSDHALPPGVRRLHALDTATGKPVWTYEINSTLLTTPTLGKDVIFITITGEVIALE
jgi:outer membrane protein assembly factor BamB